jgi:hypothetical protein
MGFSFQCVFANWPYCTSPFNVRLMKAVWFLQKRNLFPLSKRWLFCVLYFPTRKDRTSKHFGMLPLLYQKRRRLREGREVAIRAVLADRGTAHLSIAILYIFLVHVRDLPIFLSVDCYEVLLYLTFSCETLLSMETDKVLV